MKFICPDCEEILEQRGPRYVCPKAMKNATVKGRKLVAPATEEHPRFKLWTVGELIENRLFFVESADRLDDKITLVGVA